VKLFVFAGAGASVELGVPAMRLMATELLEHLEATSSGDSFVASLRTRLDDTGGDLEQLIEDIDRICGADQVLPAFGHKVAPDLSESARLTRSEIEWFVQHSCERVRAEGAATLWAPLLHDVGDIELTIATTNYDRSIELAAQRYGVKISDGFGAFGQREWSTWSGFTQEGVRLLKLHGSTDWYQVVDTPQVAKLRHPMPLFGGVTLQVAADELGALGSALVLPSREKRTNSPPFPQISHEMFATSRAADAAVFVGTSLRDVDVQSLAAECAARVPTLIVGPGMAHGQGIPPEAAIVDSMAAEFLISTLPRMLSEGAWPEPKSVVRFGDGEGHQDSILHEVNTLLDAGAADQTKCIAIESLWKRSVSLGTREIRPLLGVGSGALARDALALVDLSRDRAELLDTCEQLAADTTDASFARDLALLKQG